MNRAEGGSSRGYTIVETLIFLAVSGAMFVSAMALINGRQARTEFTTGVRDFESSINDIANDVSDGYFDNSATNIYDEPSYIKCSGAPGGVVVDGEPAGDVIGSTQGTNGGCIFIGKAVQFAPVESSITGDNTTRYATIPLVGLQFKSANPALGDTESYAQSGIKAVYPATNSAPSDTTPKSFQALRIGGGTMVGCVVYFTDAATRPQTDKPCQTTGRVDIDTVAFMTILHGSYTVGGKLKQEGGNSQVKLLVSKTSASLSRPTADVARMLNNFATDGTEALGGVYVCLQSGGTDQHALITLGGSSSSFSTSSLISSGSCS